MSSAGAGAQECPICGGAPPRRRYQLRSFDILACRRCGQVYLRPLPSPEVIRKLFSQLYSGHEVALPELKGYYDYCYDDDPANPLVQRYEIWLDALERERSPGRLLDIGCGTGLFLAVARRRGWQPFGIDESAEATEHARRHFGLEVWIGDFADFPADQAFDAITGWDIIEHARDPLALLRRARDCLVPGGALAVSTPNQRSILDLVAGALYRASGGRLRAPLEKFYIEQHFLYFTPATLAQALARAGLELRALERELTDLRRLHLGSLERLVLEALFRVSRWTGRENRLFAIARAPRQALVAPV
jgi:SAM-dependent methyltransferase